MQLQTGSAAASAALVGALGALAGGPACSARAPNTAREGACAPRFLPHRRGLGILLLCALGSWSFAAVPTLDHLFPVAVQVGTTNSISAIGKFDPWPPQVWADAPGIVFKPETNSGKLVVEVAADAPIGPHLIRVFNEQGTSGPRFLIVTRDPQLAEQEPNDDFAKPHLVDQLPASLNGRLAKSGDVDSFGVTLAAGQTLVASAEAYTLASPLDAVLRLVDARGVQVAWNHDDGRTLDPFLAWTAKSADTYVLQVFGFVYPAESQVRFTGNNKCVYRLHLSRGPYLRHALPLGVQRGTNARLTLIGWNFSNSSETHFDGAALPATISQTLWQPPGFANAISIPVGDGLEFMEQEPNDAAVETNRLEVPGAVTGRVDQSGDEDRFSFTASKGEKFLFQVQSASLGFPLDAWLRVEDLKGKELAKNDDAVSADPKLDWTAPEEGRFVAAVGSVLHRGGADYLYRLTLQHAAPALKANLTQTALAIAPGKTNELKITIKRLYGFDSTMTVTARGMPDGVEAESLDVPKKSEAVTLKVVATAEAKPFSGPIRIALIDSESQKEYPAVADLTSSTVNNGVPGGFNKLIIDSAEHLWLTVLPPEKQEKETRP